MPTKI